MAYELGANPRESTVLMASMSYLLLLSNTIGMVFRANSSGDHSLLAFIFTICSSFFLLEYCHSVYHQLPRGQNSVRKSILAVAIWCLFTGIVFGITSQCAPYFNFAFALTMHAAAFVASTVIFYAYIIYDDDDCAGGNSSGERCNDKDSTSFSGAHVEINFDKV